MNHRTISCSSICILFWLPLSSLLLSGSIYSGFPDSGRSDTVSIVSLELKDSTFLVPNALEMTQ